MGKTKLSVGSVRREGPDSDSARVSPAVKPVSLAPLSFEDVMRRIVGVTAEKPIDDDRCYG